MKTAAFCIKHRVTTIMAYIMIVIFGVMGFNSLPLALMPDMEFPMAIVITTYSGAGPQEVENLVTKTIEQGAALVSGMDELSSISSEGSSMVIVTFTDDTDMDDAIVDLREKIDIVSSYLPDDAGTPTVIEMDPDSIPVVQIGLTGSDLVTLQALSEDTISPALERINGVASVDIIGGYSNRIVVDTYADRIAGYGLSVSYIAQIIGAENISLPAGDVSNGNQTLTVRTDGEFTSIDDISLTLIPLPAGGTVQLSDIADVKYEAEEQTDIAKVEGNPAIVLSVSKQSGVNTVKVADSIKEELAELSQENINLEYQILMDQSDYINLSVDSVINNIVIGVALAAVVLLVFLRSIGATAVIAMSMPICIISVFLIMQVLGITMNMMSLGGMAMGVGMIVDNSIVVLENIFSYRSDGHNRLDACVKGTSEVALAISASTLTTVSVFLPLALTDGIVGMMFSEFSITIVALLLASLVIALTFVPLLCYILMDRRERKTIRVAGNDSERVDNPLTRLYKAILKFFITRRAVAVLLSIVMIVVFATTITSSRFEMMPTMDEGIVNITMDLPVGAELEEAQAIADKVTAYVHENVPELADTYYTISTGSSVSGMGSSSSGLSTSATVNLVDLEQRTRSAEEVSNDIRDGLSNIAGAQISVATGGTMDMSSLTGDAISITLSGDDYDVLSETAENLAKEIALLPDAIEVASSASEKVPEVNIKINRQSASRFGLTAASIGTAVYGELSGATATQLKVGGEEITVAVRGDERSSESLDSLKNIPIPTATGGSVPLSLVADIVIELSPQQITRLNQSRTVTITGNSLSGDSVAISADVQAIIDDFVMPTGVMIESGGEMESMIESFTSLAYALIVAVGLVYFVLASQFESFLMPFIIMTILPIGLLGALFGLPVTNNAISIPSFIGVIMLAGTVVNSSIVLIDYINTRRENGEEKNVAILNACPRRVRPVLMTTLTTILGLMPMALGIGEGSEMMAPMAIVMITGMIISTIVTLFFTPVYYSIIDSIADIKGRKQRRKDKKERKKQAKLLKKISKISKEQAGVQIAEQDENENLEIEKPDQE